MKKVRPEALKKLKIVNKDTLRILAGGDPPENATADTYERLGTCGPCFRY